MGALTNKLYTYQGRVWELRGLETLSIRSGYFQVIKVDISQRKILRILPIVGTEEWIDDTTRFFISEKRAMSSFATVNIISQFSLENTMILITSMGHRKISTKEILTSIVLEIVKNKTLSVIVGDQIDTKLIEKLRSLENLRDIVDISIGFRTTRKSSINNDIETEFEEDECLIALTDIKKVASLLFSQIETFKQNDGELYTGFASGDVFESYVGSNTEVFKNIIEGQIMFSELPIFVVADSFTRYLPFSVKRVILDISNLSSYISQALREEKDNLKSKYLNLDGNLQIMNLITKDIYVISSSLDKLRKSDLFVKVTSFWNDKRVYFDFLGIKKETHRIHPVQDTSTHLDILELLHTKLNTLTEAFRSPKNPNSITNHDFI
jgi:hypothetical protein